MWDGNAIDKVNSLKKHNKEVNYVIVQSDGFAYYWGVELGCYSPEFDRKTFTYKIQYIMWASQGK